MWLFEHILFQAERTGLIFIFYKLIFWVNNKVSHAEVEKNANFELKIIQH